MSRGWFASVLLLVPGALAAATNPWVPSGSTPPSRSPSGAPGPTLEVSGNLAPVALPAEIWFALGLARDDRGDAGAAIAAYSRALELRPDLVPARFQRGQAYARQRDAAQARRDLRAVVQAGGTSFDVEQARRLLTAL
jgi:tetratricopeptide (TPR) repeat protein